MSQHQLVTSKRRTRLFGALKILSAVALVGVLIAATGTNSAATVSVTGPSIDSVTQLGKAFSAVAKEASPAVVGIKVQKKAIMTDRSTRFESPFGDDLGEQFFRRFFGQPGPNMPNPPGAVGQGSGFIVSKDGYIITNNHVVENADTITVSLQDRRELTATVVGTDPRSDVAVIKVDASDLPTVAVGDSDALEVGEWVVAVGNPFGLTHTVTAGIVSARGRSAVGIADYEDFIQTDAAINPGNSGGPLLNLKGEVVGVNTAIFSRSGGYMGIGFAIPINMVKGIKDQLVSTGTVTRGYLGVIIQNVTPDLAEGFGLKDAAGALVAQVADDSPAAKAGFKRGDVVVELNGKPVEEIGRFRNRVASLAPGATAEVTVLRDGKKVPLTVTIGTLPESAGSLASARTDSVGDLGVTVKNLTPDMADQLGMKDEEGVVVTAVAAGSPAEQAGLRPGMLIQEVNRTPVSDVAAFRSALKDAGDTKPILLLVRDREYARFMTLRPRS